MLASGSPRFGTLSDRGAAGFVGYRMIPWDLRRIASIIAVAFRFRECYRRSVLQYSASTASPHTLPPTFYTTQGTLANTKKRNNTKLGQSRPYFEWQPRVRWLPQTQIMLWVTLKEPPRALQTSECRELLNPTRTSCLILAQRQPGKLPSTSTMRKRPRHTVLAL
jgi:hypothetical protein